MSDSEVRSKKASKILGTFKKNLNLSLVYSNQLDHLDILPTEQNCPLACVLKSIEQSAADRIPCLILITLLGNPDEQVSSQIDCRSQLKMAQT